MLPVRGVVPETEEAEPVVVQGAEDTDEKSQKSPSQRVDYDQADSKVLHPKSNAPGQQVGEGRPRLLDVPRSGTDADHLVDGKGGEN